MQVRLAEIVVALSGIGDLGRERKAGAAARSCVVGCRIGRQLGLAEDEIGDIFYTALLQHVGCLGYAQEAAAVFQGRDVEMNLAGAHTDFSNPASIFRTFIPELSAGTDLLTTARILTAALSKAPKLGPVIHRASCEVASTTARRIGLRSEIQDALLKTQEWYDGKGGYLGESGHDIPMTARVVQTAMVGVVFHDFAGIDAALDVVSSRAGKQLDPDVAAAFAVICRDALMEIESGDVDSLVLREEPKPHLLIDDEGIDEAAVAFGEIVDLKTDYTHGAARRAYDLADAAATALGLADRAPVRRAAALRDIGKAAISNNILDKDAPLTRAEEDEVRLHPYRTERLLARTPLFATEAALAALHHEHEDGSGYHRGVPASAIPLGGKILAAVDAFIDATQPRTGTPLSPTAACSRLRTLAERGELDGDVVSAVTAAVEGRSKPLRRTAPAGLSERQVEVLRLMAKGLSNKEIAKALVVSPRTAEHHVQDIYLKIGVASRAAAALFAMEHQLL